MKEKTNKSARLMWVVTFIARHDGNHELYVETVSGNKESSPVKCNDLIVGDASKRRNAQAQESADNVYEHLCQLYEARGLPVRRKKVSEETWFGFDHEVISEHVFVHFMEYVGPSN